MADAGGGRGREAGEERDRGAGWRRVRAPGAEAEHARTADVEGNRRRREIEDPCRAVRPEVDLAERQTETDGAARLCARGGATKAHSGGGRPRDGA